MKRFKMGGPYKYYYSNQTTIEELTRPHFWGTKRTIERHVYLNKGYQRITQASAIWQKEYEYEEVTVVTKGS